MILDDYDNVQAINTGESRKLVAGGYVCKVASVRTQGTKSTNKPMLVLAIDITEGEFAGYFKKKFENDQKFNEDFAKWSNNAVYYQPIFDSSGKISSYFKGLLTCIEKSNNGFKAIQKDSNGKNRFDENLLKGKLCGFIFGEEEYMRNDGSIAKTVRVKFPRPADDIRAGNFDIPKVKEIEKKQNSKSNAKTDEHGIFKNSEDVEENDLPF